MFGAFVVALALTTGATVVAAELRTESKHFVIAYESGTSFDYVSLVQRGLEAAYDLFVVRSGFPTFPEPVAVFIRDDGEGSMGSERLEAGMDATPLPVVEMALEASMQAAADATATGLSLTQAVLSTTAHEFFHVLQDYASLHGEGDVSEAAFVEPLATAAQEVAAPDANDYVDAAADFLLAPDAMSFFDRDYDAGLFWVFVLDRFGGLDAVRRVMKASADHEGRLAIDRAFAPQGLTFLDLWAKFVIALATDTLPDAAIIAKLRASWRSEIGLRNLDLPPALAATEWIGRPEVLDRVTEASVAGILLGYSDSEPGDSLRVAYAYGIDVVSIRPRSAAPLAISVDAPQTAALRVAVTGRKGDAWTLLSVSGGDVVVGHPQRYDELRVILTRGETDSGSYRVRLTPG